MLHDDLKSFHFVFPGDLLENRMIQYHQVVDIEQVFDYEEIYLQTTLKPFHEMLQNFKQLFNKCIIKLHFA